MKLGEGEVRRWRQGLGLSSEVSLTGRSQGEEGQSRQAGYVIIIVEQRGCLFSSLNTRTVK